MFPLRRKKRAEASLSLFLLESHLGLEADPAAANQGSSQTIGERRPGSLVHAISRKHGEGMGVVESMNTVTLAGGNKVELNEFQWSMLELDCALTGHSPAEAWNPIRNQPSTPEAFIEKSDIWYLSDGGYLRLVFRFETGALFLASESTDKVRRPGTRAHNKSRRCAASSAPPPSDCSTDETWL